MVKLLALAHLRGSWLYYTSKTCDWLALACFLAAVILCLPRWYHWQEEKRTLALCLAFFCAALSWVCMVDL